MFCTSKSPSIPNFKKSEYKFEFWPANLLIPLSARCLVRQPGLCSDCPGGSYQSVLDLKFVNSNFKRRFEFFNSIGFKFNFFLKFTFCALSNVQNFGKRSRISKFSCVSSQKTLVNLRNRRKKQKNDVRNLPTRA